MIDDFIAVGKNAYGNTHLICVENLEKLSLKKIEKIVENLALILRKLPKSLHCSDTFLF